MADADKSLTPEKKLLKLIEEPEARKSGRAGGSKAAFPWKDLFSIQALRERFAGMGGPWSVLFGAGRKHLGLREANALTVIVTIALSIFFAGDLLYEVKIANKNLWDDLEIPKAKVTDFEIAEERILESISLENMDSRNIFMPFDKRTDVVPEQKKESVSAQILDRIKNLKLTGISYNPDDPSRIFCMIEDIEKGITSFLRIGDQISGLKVAKISEENVTLELGKETAELR